MKLMCFWLLLIVLQDSGPPEQSIKKDLQVLEGTWKLIDFEWAGKKLTDDAKQRNSVAIFKGDRMIRRTGDSEFVYRLKLDPSKSPKEVDLLQEKGEGVVSKTEGIYDINGDVLRICTVHRAGEKRPTAFRTSMDRSSAEYGWVISVFRREK